MLKTADELKTAQVQRARSSGRLIYEETHGGGTIRPSLYCFAPFFPVSPTSLRLKKTSFSPDPAFTDPGNSTGQLLDSRDACLFSSGLQILPGDTISGFCSEPPPQQTPRIVEVEAQFAPRSHQTRGEVKSGSAVRLAGGRLIAALFREEVAMAARRAGRARHACWWEPGTHGGRCPSSWLRRQPDEASLAEIYIGKSREGRLEQWHGAAANKVK